MKFKLDENLGRRGQTLLSSAGHDVATVYDENLTSAEDLAILSACQREGRCLVTLDLDFGNPLRFVPSDFFGIAVLRLPAKPSQHDLLATIQTLATAVDRSR